MQAELIIKYIKKKKQKGLEMLIDEYSGLVASVVRKNLGKLINYEEECISDVFLAIWDNIDSFDKDKNSFKNWICVIAKYKAINYKKKYLDKSISSKLDNIIEQREVVLEPKLRDFNFIEDKKETASYAISPIIVSGDAIGAVIIFPLDNNLGEFEEKTVSIAAKFLGKYIEE